MSEMPESAMAALSEDDSLPSAGFPDEEHWLKVGLRARVDGPVAHFTLERPASRNSQTPGTWYALAEAAAALPEDVRVVIVRGHGGHFSAGLDKGALEGKVPDGETESTLDLMNLTDAQMADKIGEYQQGFLWLRRPDLITIAVVEGWSIGAGFQLALACDLRVCAEDAKFSMRESALGLVPDLTGTKPLVELVGYGRALEICATARTVEAAEARDLGIANVVVPGDQIDGAVEDLVGALTSPMAGAIAGTKQILLAASGNSLEEQVKLEREVQVGRFRELPALFGL